MPNSTISGLPVAATLDGTELLPLVQGGVTKQAAASLFRNTIAAALLTPLTVTVSSGAPISLLRLSKTSGNSSYIDMKVGSSGDMTMTAGSLSGTGAVLALNIQTILGSRSGLLLDCGVLASTSVVDVSVVTGDLKVAAAGKGLQVKEGANAKQGVATLVAGQVVVANTSITASSRVFLTAQSLGTVTAPKAIAITARTVGTSFTITSADNTDTSVIGWEIFEPAT